MRNEADVNGEHYNIFIEIDKNGDEKITKEELQAWFKEQGADLPDGVGDRGQGRRWSISFDEFGGHRAFVEDDIDPNEMDHETMNFKFMIYIK